MSLNSQLHDLAALLKKEPPVPIVWMQKPVLMVHRREKNTLHLSGFEHGTIQLSHYANYAIPANHLFLCLPLFIVYFVHNLSYSCFYSFCYSLNLFFNQFSSPVFLRCFHPSLSALSISSLQLLKVR